MSEEIVKEKRVETPEAPIEPTSPPAKDNVEDLQAKIADQSQKLAGSKAEALNLKSQLDAQSAEINRLKTPAEPAQAVNQDDVELFKTYARQAGVPLKEDLEAMKVDSDNRIREDATAKFLEEYPEYKPENDKDNSKWEGLVQEYALYRNPTTPNTKNYLSLLKKAHKAVSPDNSHAKGEALGMAKAKLGEQAQLGGSGGVTTEKNTKRTPEQEAFRAQFAKLRPDVFKQS